jgi:hypothetical protein
LQSHVAVAVKLAGYERFIPPDELCNVGASQPAVTMLFVERFEQSMLDLSK